MPKVILTEAQRKKLENLWFKWGNHGPKSTHSNHRFIQCILERGEDARVFFKPTEELLLLVDEILKI